MEGVTEERADLITKLSYRQARRSIGKVPEPFAVTAHHRKLFLGYGGFEMAVERSHEVDERLKALGEMKAALMAGCEFCIDIGTFISYRAGVTERQLRELPSYRDSDAFTDLEKLVIEYAEGMTSTPVRVSDELFARLREHFSEKQLVELTAVIAVENYRARFNWAFGIGPQGFTKDGDFCPVPERAGSVPASGSNEQ
jgi:AhpD family alkylhydroperoxidase